MTISFIFRASRYRRFTSTYQPLHFQVSTNFRHRFSILTSHSVNSRIRSLRGGTSFLTRITRLATFRYNSITTISRRVATHQSFRRISNTRRHKFTYSKRTRSTRSFTFFRTSIRVFSHFSNSSTFVGNRKRIIRFGGTRNSFLTSFRRLFGFIRCILFSRSHLRVEPMYILQFVQTFMLPRTVTSPHNQLTRVLRFTLNSNILRFLTNGRFLSDLTRIRVSILNTSRRRFSRTVVLLFRNRHINELRVDDPEVITQRRDRVGNVRKANRLYHVGHFSFRILQVKYSVISHNLNNVSFTLRHRRALLLRRTREAYRIETVIHSYSHDSIFSIVSKLMLIKVSTRTGN